MIKKTGIIGAISLVASQVVQKGVFVLLRIRKTANGWKVQSHLDWDCDAYEGLVELADVVKNGKTNIDISVKEKSEHNG